MTKRCVLIVDDEAPMLEVCAQALQPIPDLQVLVETESRRAAERLEAEGIDLLITDLLMPGVAGIELLRQARQRNPNLAAVIMTGHPAVETAVECMKLGAADYLAKPFRPEDLQAAVRRLLDGQQLRDENRFLRRQVEKPYACGQILGHTPAMEKICESVQRAAATEFDVMVVGETGTGKELVARAIHQGSRRKDGPFVPVDCGAIPEELMEREFFGHERGAFTGAQSRSLGLMEYSNQGTFFMDEMGQMPLRLQAKLLRVLQERRIRRIGGTEEIPLDLRIVVASSVDLREAVQRERFRLDLYHRINVVRIELPPLRRRLEDIPLLVRHFVKRFALDMERGPVEVSPEAMEILTSYPWPGNIRELQNVMKRTLALLNSSVINPEHLPDDIVVQAGESAPVVVGGFFEQRGQQLAAFEAAYFRSLLSACAGDVPAAAQQARIPRGTLYRLLKKHSLDPGAYRAQPSASAGA